MAKKSSPGCGVAIVILVGVLVLGFKRCGNADSGRAPKLTASANRTEGTAVYILIDVSGSMDDTVPNAKGVEEAKLSLAKQAATDACKSITQYAAEDPKRNIRLALASFSNDFKLEIPMAKPNLVAAKAAIDGLATRGQTAIGNAIVEAQRSLDKTGLKSQHILVITDGENNSGATPENVADALNALPEALRPSVYIVAFDVNADVFSRVKDKGWQVFPAADGKQLQQQLDEVVGGKILIEK